MAPTPAGIYVHVPFCIRKCPYCDFYSTTDLSLTHAFVTALTQEMQMRSETRFRCQEMQSAGEVVQSKGESKKPGFLLHPSSFLLPPSSFILHPSFDTLYIGGGTPSVLTPGDIGRIMEAAGRSFEILPDAEMTIEANPGTLSLEKLREYRRAGVNRINIGVQSFQDAALRFLGRIHSGRDAKLAIQWARQAGFENIGIDLIYGIPGQQEASWVLDLKRAVEFEPAHLSCYMLTYESDTRMERDRQSGRFDPLSEELGAMLFERTMTFSEAHGYIQYEISNFARSTREKSRHNQKYWSDVPYLGLGPSAHSFSEPMRCWNHRSLKKYMADIRDGRLPTADAERLTREERMTEMIYAGLRQSEGIAMDRFEQKFGINFADHFRQAMQHLEEEGLVRRARNRCMLSRKGKLFLDSIALLLV